MFTGIVETSGKIISRDVNKLIVMPEKKLPDPVPGESIAVNGCCLTLERAKSGGELVFHALEQTLMLTNLGSCNIVNLERAMAANGRFGGHIVSGHIDCCSEILHFGRKNGDIVLEIAMPEEFRLFAIERGSVAVDGVSLTIAALTDNSLKICLIPTTLAETALAERFARREKVNLEFDLTGKYIVNAVLGREKSGQPHSGSVTWNMLEENGFL